MQQNNTFGFWEGTTGEPSEFLEDDSLESSLDFGL